MGECIHRASGSQDDLCAHLASRHPMEYLWKAYVPHMVETKVKENLTSEWFDRVKLLKLLRL
jgi:hypothetical protein